MSLSNEIQDLELPGELVPQYEYLVSLFTEKNYVDCIEGARKLLELAPKSKLLLNLLGASYTELHQYDPALDCLVKAVEIDPEFALAWTNIAVMFLEQGNMPQALKTFQKAIRLDPRNPHLHYSIARVLNSLGMLVEAEAACRVAMELDPRSVGAHFNRGAILARQGKLDIAKTEYSAVCVLDPANSEAMAMTLFLAAQMCDWSGVRGFKKRHDWLGIESEPIGPFTVLSYDGDPATQQLRARKFSASQSKPLGLPEIARPSQRPDKIKVAYFSSDIFGHATMLLLADVLKGYDREKFEIHIYSYGNITDKKLQEQVAGMVDRFWNIRGSADIDIAGHVRAQGIDIAVDLKGYTEDGRTAMFANRLAPIQINYLGYPGTLGADFMDYIIADPVVITDETRPFYDEKVISLPDSYQPNGERIASDQATTRADHGLPENGFVFCCFNNNYKIMPEEFIIWIQLLKQVEGSVLWLIESNQWSAANIKNHAQKLGVDPERIIFAPKADHGKHLERHKHADLFLDTFNYNAHTTASDALWAGLPMVTKAGKTFASRVGASILSAANLPELVTNSSAEYEALALDLATHPEKLSAISDKLRKDKDKLPLFDSPSYISHLEAAYSKAYDLWFEQKPAEDIIVAK